MKDDPNTLIRTSRNVQRFERPTDDPHVVTDSRVTNVYDHGAMNASQAAASAAAQAEATERRRRAQAAAEADAAERERRREAEDAQRNAQALNPSRGGVLGVTPRGGTGASGPIPREAPIIPVATTAAAGSTSVGTWLNNLPPIEVDIGAGPGGGVGINIGQPIPGVGDGRPAPPVFEQPRTQPVGPWPGAQPAEPGMLDAVGGPVVAAAVAVVVAVVAVGGAVVAAMSKAK